MTIFPSNDKQEQFTLGVIVDFKPGNLWLPKYQVSNMIAIDILATTMMKEDRKVFSVHSVVF